MESLDYHELLNWAGDDPFRIFIVVVLVLGFRMHFMGPLFQRLDRALFALERMPEAMQKQEEASKRLQEDMNDLRRQQQLLMERIDGKSRIAPIVPEATATH